MTSADGGLAGFEGVNRVVAEPLRLKHKLAIGEDAYASMRVARKVGDLALAGGGAAAGGAAAASTAVAGTFFGGWLTAAGIATAATPVGWVIGAAALSGGVCYGVTKLLREYGKSRVHVIPAFINTPIDVLGMSLFDLMAGLALKLAEAGDGIDEEERVVIRDVFVQDWGLDSAYVEHALPVVEHALAGKTLESAARELAQFQRDNPDCNPRAMHADLLGFLHEIAEADGRADPAELAAISRVDAIFQEAHRGPMESAANGVASGLLQAAAWVSGMLPARGSKAEPPVTPGEAPSYLDRIWSWARSGETEAMVSAVNVPVPVLWLLGRTGAGKSTLVRTLTGETVAEVGNGFTSCTRTAVSYDHPAEMPVLRFLDTRGLAEVGYDPAEDLSVCERGSHAILAVARLDDPVQGELADVLRQVRRRRPVIPILVIHTGADLLPDAAARVRARSRTQTSLEQAAGGALPWVEVARPEALGRDAPPEDLLEALAKLLPETALILMDEDRKDAEGRAFAANRSMVLWFAASAAATDAAPVVGLVTVPGLQGAMLHRLAKVYGVEWTKARAAAFAGALGTSVLLRVGVELLLRQAIKLTPVYGQTVGAASAATISFSTTLALGRAAAAWLHYEAQGETMGAEALQKRYREALGRAVLARS